MKSVDSEDSLSASHPGGIGSPKVKAWLTCLIKKSDCDWVGCDWVGCPQGFVIASGFAKLACGQVAGRIC
jgi:hypothetical protein